MKRLLAIVAIVVFRASLGAPPTFAAEPPRPNILFILADDLGWMDTSLYGSRFYETPHLERLARRGMMFLNAYAANPLCSPTRASILTGLYPGRIGLTTPACHLPQVVLETRLPASGPPAHKALTPTSLTRLPTSYPTVSRLFKAAGYATAHFGKWHLGPEPYSPLQQGFDVDLPHFPGPGPVGGYLGPWKYWNAPAKTGEHIDDRLAREASRFIREHRDQPWYVNFWAFSVHAPFNAKPELVERYRAKAAQLPPDAPQRNPIYAAMVHSLDDAIGQLLDTLDELRLAERTIIVFFSDNGGVHWTANKETGENHRDALIPITSNAPLRGGKATLFEGGTREPCVVVWPGHVRPGSRSEALVSSVDWLPTLLEMARIPQPREAICDGVSQVPALQQTGKPRTTAFCHFPHYVPATANRPGVWVRKDDWKLLRYFADADDQTDRHELYDLRADPGETRDLAAREPDRVREMARLIDEHLRSIQAVLPRPNPAYRRTPLTAAGWVAAKDLTGTVENQEFVLRSTGGDPILQIDSLPAGTGPFQLEIRMKSKSQGQGQVFWAAGSERPIFERVRSKTFPIQHDGEWHEYQVEIPVTTALARLRFDPSQAPGELRIAWMRLRDRAGKILKDWTFAAVPPAP